MAKREYEIWIEGYAATGEHSTASYIGKGFGETFEEAVINFRYPDDGEPINLDKDENQPDGFRRYGGRLCSWACGYFDNESDARKSFG